jgi:hypothetical protein
MNVIEHSLPLLIRKIAIYRLLAMKNIPSRHMLV